MSSQHYLVLAYVAGLALLWGYALSLWAGAGALRARARRALNAPRQGATP